MQLTFGFSPCPNDTFIFDAIINGRIQQVGLTAAPVIEDVEHLNDMAQHGQLDVTKLSCSAYPFVSNIYQVLKSGAALGHNCGPLLVMKENFKWSDLSQLRIAIPGRLTTANLLLNMFAPAADKKQEFLFSEIENAVLKGKADVGLIIHESRFTYEQKGLKKLADFGELWEQYTGNPLPLGCIAVRRDLPELTKFRIEQWIHNSVKYAFEHPQASMQFIKEHASEMSEEVQKKHIALYVNEFSLDLGEQGMKAMNLLFRRGHELNILPPCETPVFFN